MNEKSLQDVLDVRKFESGAIRDTDTHKIDYEGHLNPLVLQRFARYMHEHRQTAAGPRASDDWQRGMPLDVYMKSLHRHFMDVWMSHRYPEIGINMEDALCGVMFNAMGYLLEVLNVAPSPAVHVNRAMDIATHAHRIVPRQNLVSVEHPPWVIQTVMPLLDPRQRWYMSIDNSLHVLEPWVKRQGDDKPPPDLHGFYVYWRFSDETAGWLLKIEDCPPEIRDRWNAYLVDDDRTEAEYRELLTWQRGLYNLKGDRYQLKPQCKAWARG